MAIIRIEVPETQEALTEFVCLQDVVYANRSARWAASVQFDLHVLRGTHPFANGRTFRPFIARENGRIVARVLAVIDAQYQRHWQERLGHLWWFEALPESRESVKQLIDDACAWLQQHGAEAARVGYGMLEFPFVIGAYESLPPTILRHNPPYYHALLKDAGCEIEKGLVDYQIRVRPELLDRWQSGLDAARHVGYEIVPLRAVPEDRRVAQFTATFNETFQAHWGWTPFTQAEIQSLFAALSPLGMLDTSVLAYRNGEPVGMLLVTPEHSNDAILKPGRVLYDSEKLNVLAIGVRESARGRGVNMAMAGYGLLELVRRGAKYLSYTLVLDDNWPSRRTGEKLGGYVCANYVVYRRNFRR
jgi:GNAT superfamily N-acetyltransferase